MTFDPGIGVVPVREPLGFRYESGTFGPQPETRSLDAIRQSLRNPACTGPDPVYAIVMDIGREEVHAELKRRMLLFGAVIYASGTLGQETVRSQGHVHHVSLHSGWSPPEVYEIWEGAAYIFMQEYAVDDPGRCYAILAKPGDMVVVPPKWAHAAMSADPSSFMALGALCDREYSFDYDAIRKRQGLAWYPIVTPNGVVEWAANPNYQRTRLDVRRARNYAELGFVQGVSLYDQAVRDLDRFAWVSKPALCEEVWKHFEP
ncbi:MAG TPA: glucose-6-phosphate isomerase family protein [Candidatus Sulfotelmatobacter sp.]|nr:glucose-6-phosphate isomerase family protein [Candidatus Sulfotelmatobacter sp.]